MVSASASAPAPAALATASTRSAGGGNRSAGESAFVSASMARRGNDARRIQVVRAHTGRHSNASVAAVTLTASLLPPGGSPRFAHRSNSRSGVRNVPSASRADVPGGHRARGWSTPRTSRASRAKISTNRNAPAYCSRSSIASARKGPGGAE